MSFWKRWQSWFHNPFLASIAPPSSCDIAVVQNAGINTLPPGVFLEAQLLKLLFRTLPLNIYMSNFAAGNIRRCSEWKYSFNTLRIHIISAGVAPSDFYCIDVRQYYAKSTRCGVQLCNDSTAPRSQLTHPLPQQQAYMLELCSQWCSIKEMVYFLALTAAMIDPARNNTEKQQGNAGSSAITKTWCPQSCLAWQHYRKYA